MRTSRGRVHLLEVEGGGSLPPVVLLHGYAASALSWWPLLRRLRPHVRRIVAPDLPAHGQSEVPPSGLDADALGEGLREALDRALDEPAVILGNSLGGAAAIDYARHRPTRALVLASPGGAASSAEELRALVERFELRSHADSLAFVDRLLGRPSRLRTLYALGIRRRFARRELRAFLRSIEPERLLSPGALGELSVPILLVWGRGDRVLPAEHREFFRRHLPAHAEIDEPAAVGHCPFLDDADGFSARVLEFLRALPQSA